MSHSALLTFEEIEGDAGRTYAFAVFVAHAKTGARALFGAAATIYLARRLKRLLSRFSPSFIESCSAKQAEELVELMQPLHAQLTDIFQNVSDRELPVVKRVPFLGKAVISLEGSTEVLEDILEDLSQLHDKEFQGLISGAIKGLNVRGNRLETVHH